MISKQSRSAMQILAAAVELFEATSMLSNEAASGTVPFSKNYRQLNNHDTHIRWTRQGGKALEPIIRLARSCSKREEAIVAN